MARPEAAHHHIGMRPGGRDRGDREKKTERERKNEKKNEREGDREKEKVKPGICIQKHLDLVRIWQNLRTKRVNKT